MLQSLLASKGTMSEAELHIIRARLEGGIRNKAARGELRRGLPVGFVWGEQDGEVLLHPDEAVQGAIRAVFERFAEMGSARQVWLWFRTEGLRFPLQSYGLPEIRWIVPTYTKIHQVLTNPVYAGAYVYGKSRQERYVDETGRIKKRLRHLPRAEWQVLIVEHHEGYIDWESYEKNQARIATNIRPQKHQPGGAVRGGAALLQGIATCGHCGRRLAVHYRGKNSSAGYHCAGDSIVNGRRSYCLTVGGCQIDRAVTEVFLQALTPAGLKAAVAATERLEADLDNALRQWRLEVERARYEAERAERRYRAVEPENRLVARGLETQWEKRLQDLATAEAELDRRRQQRPAEFTAEQRKAIQQLGADIKRVWSAPTTTDRDKKELLRTLIEEVIVAVKRDERRALLTVRWRGGIVNNLNVDLPRSYTPPIRTKEETIDLVRRLARYYPDATIAGILNRQGRPTATGERFTTNIVGNLRRYWKIPRFEPSADPPEGELATIKKAAKILGVAESTVHRWLADGFIAGEQVTPGAPWRIRITKKLLDSIVEKEPDGYVPIQKATRLLRVSRQAILQRVKRGELSAVHIYRGRAKGLRIKVISAQQELFGELHESQG